MLYYKGSSRQLRKLRHKLIKQGFTDGTHTTRWLKKAKGIYLFKASQRFLIWESEMSTEPSPDLIYKGRQYKQALQALNIPV